MTPEQTIKHCLSGYYRALHDGCKQEHPFDRRFYDGQVFAFIEIAHAVAAGAGIDDKEVLEIQEQVFIERHRRADRSPSPHIKIVPVTR